MTYSLTLRENLGRLLTIQEMDGNFKYIDGKFVTPSMATPSGLSDVLLVGNTFSNSIVLSESGGIIYGASDFSEDYDFASGFYSGNNFPGITGTVSSIWWAYNAF